MIKITVYWRPITVEQTMIHKLRIAYEFEGWYKAFTTESIFMVGKTQRQHWVIQYGDRMIRNDSIYVNKSTAKA